jgi:hypothetical protein
VFILSGICMINNTTAKASISDYKTHTDNNRDIVTEHLA